jgi:hypothetical protein
LPCGSNSTLSYLRLQVPHRLEALMKRSNPIVQHDLFSSVPAAPPLTSLESHHDELVELLSRVLWELACGAVETMAKEVGNDEDHR